MHTIQTVAEYLEHLTTIENISNLGCMVSCCTFFAVRQM